MTVGPGWGAGNIVVKVRGKIAAMLHGEELVVKLPRERVDALVASQIGTRFDPRRNGKVMKEWLVVREGAADWVSLSEEAAAFAGA